MKPTIKCLVTVLIALVLGGGSALFIINSPLFKQGIKKGAWITTPDVGGTNAGMYVRAMTARIGLFALNKTETIYYQADTDDEGQRLRSDCDYRIEGKDIDARWWAITMYGEDHFLIPNELNRHAFNMKNVIREKGGTYTIHISRTEKEGNWLPSGDKDQMLALSLRCYNPEPKLYEHPEKVELPRIIRERRK